jgi:hypothetical protein
MERDRLWTLLILLALVAVFFVVGRYFGLVRPMPVVVSTLLW